MAHNENAEAADQASAISQWAAVAANNTTAIVALNPLQKVIHIIFGLSRKQCVASST